KANGNYTIDLDFSELPQSGSVPAGTFVPVFSPSLNAYVMVPATALGGGGGIPDAPSDGSYYSRRNAAWAVAPIGISDAPSDGNYYSRRNAVWSVAPTGIADAPSDGNSYGRLNGAWTQVLPIAGGTLTGSLGGTNIDFTGTSAKVMDNTASG